MGNAVKGGRGKHHSTPNARVILCGLHKSGREDILSKLGKSINEPLGDGWEYQRVSHKGLKVVSWGVGGHKDNHEVWRELYEESEALVFVVDCMNPEYLIDAKREFWFLLTEEGLRHCHVLVLANRHDEKDAMTVADIIEGLELDSISGRDWFIQGTSARSGGGIEEGVSWIQQKLTSEA